MSIVSPVLFLLAAAAAITAIWTSLKRTLPAIRTLKAQQVVASHERLIRVSTLQTRDEPATPLPRTARADSHARLKPVSHRQHHLPHAA